MNDTKDFDRLLASWLETAGPADIRREAVEGALMTARQVPQRRRLRAWLLGSGTWPASGPRLSLAALPPVARVAVLAALPVGVALGAVIAGGGLRSPGPGPAPTVGPTPTLAPTPAPSPTSSSSVAPTPNGTPVLRSDGSGIIETYAGAFVPVGPLSAGSEAPLDPASIRDTLVTLADGRVLGLGSSWPTRLPQVIWDPATGRFSDIGLLNGKRSQPSGVLLADGRVLVMGGDTTEPELIDGSYQGRIAPPTAEIFDPATGTFRALGPMVVSRWAFPSVRLADGRVLIAGGRAVNDPNPPIAEAELFDPRTNSSAATGSMAMPRTGHTLVLLADGRVLVVGGVSSDLGQSLATEIYDPETGRFSPAAPMPPMAAHPDGGQYWPMVPATAVPLRDGRVLVPGLACMEVHSLLADGHSEGYAPTQALIYDPTTDRWTATTPMPHCVSTATPLPNGQVLLTGWWNDAGAPITRTGDRPPEIEVDWSGLFDPATGETTITGAPPAGRYMSLAALPDGRVLFVGGAVRIFQ